jgi:hypothetical protein
MSYIKSIYTTFVPWRKVLQPYLGAMRAIGHRLESIMWRAIAPQRQNLCGIGRPSSAEADRRGDPVWQREGRRAGEVVKLPPVRCTRRRPTATSLPDRGPMTTTVYLVSCVARKRHVAAPAKDLYLSVWFRKARAYVESFGCPWFILSAERGLVRPDQILAPPTVAHLSQRSLIPAASKAATMPSQ